MPGKVGLFLHSELLCSEIKHQSRGTRRPLQLFPKVVTLFRKKHVKFLVHCIVKKKNGDLGEEHLRGCSLFHNIGRMSKKKVEH